MICRMLARLSSRTAKLGALGLVAAAVFIAACGGGGVPAVKIDRIECPDKLVPGGECNISGANLDLITEMQLGQGSLRVPVSQRGSKSLVIMTVPMGVTPGAYIIYYQTREDSFATGRTLIVGQPPSSSTPPVATLSPTPPEPSPTEVVPATRPPATASPAPTAQPASTPLPPEGVITIAGLEWDSAKVQTAIVSFIIERGYGYPTVLAPGTTESLWEGLVNGSVDVYLEAWTSSLGPIYDLAEENGDILPLGKSLDDSWQSAFVVPTYVIEGDPDRGIEPMAPDLKTPQDIRKYQGLFATRTTFPKARLISCISDWVCSGVNAEKVSGYGLEDVIDLVDPGSAEDLFASSADAYIGKKPWLGYLWGPTQPAAVFDLTVLVEEPYSDQCWATHKRCAYNVAKIRKAVHPSLTQEAPDIVEFLRKWKMDAATQVEVETFLGEVGNTVEDTATWYLRNKESLWTQWVPADVAEKVRQALEGR